MHHPPLASGATPPRCWLPRWHDCVLVAAFAASLAAPHLAAVCGWSRPFDAREEKRPPAEFPGIVWRGHGWLARPRTGDLVAFPAGLEAFLADRTGLRRECVVAVGRARLAGWLVAESIGDSLPARLRADPLRHAAVPGVDGWLYFLNGRRVDELAGRAAWSEGRVTQVCRRLEERTAWLAEHGIAYLVVVAPDKDSVYPEHLPSWARRPPGRTPLDQIVERAARGSGLEVVDLRGPLVAAKTAGQTYFAHDTHWNDFGALVGARAVLEAIGRRCPGVAPAPWDGYERIPTVGVGGDLAAMLGLPPAEERCDAFRWRGGPRAADAPRLFVIGDSFAAGLRSHLKPWCEVAGQAEAHRFPSDEILAARPRVVVHEIVERNLEGLGFANPQVVVQAAATALARRPGAAAR